MTSAINLMNNTGWRLLIDIKIFLSYPNETLGFEGKVVRSYCDKP